MIEYQAIIGGKRIAVNLNGDGEIILDGKTIVYSAQISGNMIRVRKNDSHIIGLCKRIGENEYEVWLKRHVIHVRLEDETSRILDKFQVASASHGGVYSVKAPMPGLVVQVNVKEGQTVDIGHGLLILEAMKMENEIRSSAKGIVKSILVTKGTAVEKGQELLIIE